MPWSTSRGVTAAFAAQVGFPGTSSPHRRRPPSQPSASGDGEGEQVVEGMESLGWGVDGERGFGERGERDEERRQAAGVVEVAVGEEEVAYTSRGDAGDPQLAQHDGAARGVEEHSLAVGQRHDQARLRSLLVDRIPGSEEDPRRTPPPSFRRFCRRERS